MLPLWTAWIGVPVALIGFVGPFAVQAGTGPFSPQGWFAVVVGLTFGAWVLAISLVAWRFGTRPVMNGIRGLDPPLSQVAFSSIWQRLPPRYAREVNVLTEPWPPLRSRLQIDAPRP